MQGVLYQDVVFEDRKNSECPLILTLNEPVDVQNALQEDEFNCPEKGVREVQVLFLNAAPPKNLWRQGIVVKGTLFSAHTAHHHRRVLMEVKAWEPIRESVSLND